MSIPHGRSFALMLRGGVFDDGALMVHTKAFVGAVSVIMSHRHVGPDLANGYFDKLINEAIAKALSFCVSFCCEAVFDICTSSCHVHVTSCHVM